MSLQAKMLFKRAVQHFLHGRYAESEATCTNLLALDNKHTGALGLLGQLNGFKSQFKQAASYYARSLAIAPGNRDVRTLLAELHTTMGDFRQALREYDRILKQHPTFTPVIAGRAETLRRQGSLEKAEAMLAPYIERGEEDYNIATVYARIAAQLKRYDEAITVLQRHRNMPSAEGQRMMFTELGKAYESKGAYDDAFEAFDACNRVAPATWDVAADQQRIEHLISVFDKATMKKLPPPTVGSDLPIFVVSMPRSGSTLVEQILASHPDVYGAGEVLFMNELVADLGLRIGSILTYPDCVRDIEPEDMDLLSGEYLEKLRALAPNSPHITDKNLGAIEQIGLIAALLPEAKIVHVKRHPLDTCVSCFIQRFVGHTMPYADSLEHLGHRYATYAHLMSHWRDELAIPMFEIEYEQLLFDQEGQTRRLLEFCGLPWNESCLQFHKAKHKVLTLSREQVNRPIYRSSVHRFRHYEKHLDPLKEALDEHGVKWEVENPVES